VAVNVEYRHENERNALQNPGLALVLKKLAQSEKACVLAVDLPGVDAALDENHRQFMCRGILGRQAGCARRDERHHGPPLRGAAKFKAAHRLRPMRRVGCAEPFDLLVTAGTHVPGALGDGCERIRGARGADRADTTADRSKACRGE
jgi:hypothetical protein